jgi:hypothetical protein
MATVKSLSLGTHALLLADVSGADGTVLLAGGTKVFVASLEPLAVSTGEVTVPVAREAFQTLKGRPRRIAAPVASAQSSEPAAAVVEEPATHAIVDDLSV